MQHLTKNLNQCLNQRHMPLDGNVGRKETQPFYKTQHFHYRVHSSLTPDTVPSQSHPVHVTVVPSLQV